MDRNNRGFKISRALWPTGARRAVATDRAAQRRRALLVKSRWLLHFLDNSRVLTLVSMLLVFSIIVALQAQLWPLFLLAAVLLALIVMLSVLASWQAYNRVPHSSVSSRGARKPAFPGALETPMPLEPPLVRVLETFDLSQTGVEHFLERSEGVNTEELELKAHLSPRRERYMTFR